MAVAVSMPRLGQSVESCIITEWVKKKGEQVKNGDVLFCYETDKAAFEETAKTDGILLDVFYNEGDEVPVLANVAVIGKSGEDTSAFRQENPQNTNKDIEIIQKAEEKPQVQILLNKNTQEIKLKVSPRAKILAESKSVKLSELQGSGPNGRIIVRDVEEALQSGTPFSNFTSSSVSITSGDFQDVPLSNIRKLIAKGMHASLQNSAQLTHHSSADARRILDSRAEIKKKAEIGKSPNITLNDMVCFATIMALRNNPRLNAHFLGEKIRTFNKVHLGIAVDTERGLMVPVLRNADELNLSALSQKIKSLAESCKKGNVDPELLKSENASFTISNLGAYGIEMFTPVINLPQTGILGVNTITYRPSDIGNGIIAIIPVIGLSLTYDHRAVDGAPASAFLAEISKQIENFKLDF